MFSDLEFGRLFGLLSQVGREPRGYDTSFSYEYSDNNESSYQYEHDSLPHLCKIQPLTGWASPFLVISLLLGIINSVIYLFLALRHSSFTHAYYLFLNCFLFANFINIVSDGMQTLQASQTYCWSAGKFACVASRTIIDFSENAQIFFLVAVVLEQVHPRITGYFKVTPLRRKLTATVIIWLAVAIFTLPEVILSDLMDFGYGVTVCTIRHDYNAIHSLRFYLHQTIVVEYLIPVLILIVTLIRVSCVKCCPREEINEDTPDDHTRQEHQDDNFPGYSGVATTLAVIFVITRAPEYTFHVLLAFSHIKFHVLMAKLIYLTIFLYPITPCVAPWVVLIGSCHHREQLKQSLQRVGALCSGRRVAGGFNLAMEEDDPEEITMDEAEKST